MNIKPLLIKYSIGFVGVAGITFVGYRSINSESSKKEKNNIKKELEKDGYTPITKNSLNFTEILASYVAIVGTKQNLKFDNFTGTKQSEDAQNPSDILWQHCEIALNSDISENILNKAKKWCVEPIAVSELLVKQEIKTLNTTTSKSENKKEWDTKINNYRTASEKVFGSLSIGNDKEQITVDHRNELKQKCLEAGKIKNHEDKYEENLKNFTNWCTDKNNN